MRWLSGVVLVLLVFLVAQPADAVQISNPNSITLMWDPSPDSTVVGYKVYSGPTSRVYTNQIDVGTATSTVVTGLVPGSTTFFAATSYNSAGTESPPSNELVYTCPGILQVVIGADQLLHVKFPAKNGHWYEVQTCTNLSGWNTISSVLAQTNGWLDVIDPNWSRAAQTFYRLVLH